MKSGSASKNAQRSKRTRKVARNAGENRSNLEWTKDCPSSAFSSSWRCSRHVFSSSRSGKRVITKYNKDEKRRTFWFIGAIS